MSIPTTGEEFTNKYKANQRVTGYGIDGVEMHMPCPFCAAENFMVFKVIDADRVLGAETTCSECTRSGQHLIQYTPSGCTSEFVQTAGPNPPPYLYPAPRLLKKAQYG